MSAARGRTAAGDEQADFDHAGARAVLRAIATATVAAFLLAGCAANGDFGRLRSEYIRDGIHDWVGAQAATMGGVPISTYPLTEDERLLRDRAFQLIEPAYDRNRWYSILNEYGLSRVFQRDWCYFNITEYDSYLKTVPFRSATARYARLNDAIRNDVVRIPTFVAVARRVLDMDARRAQSLEHIAMVSPGEVVSAQARIAENGLIMSWVQQSLVNRAATYRYALERLVIATPVPMAAEVDRSLTLLKTSIAENRLIPGAEIEPGPIVYLAPYPPPPAAAGPRVAGVVAPR